MSYTREVRSSKSMLLFYAILGLGLGESMHEPHKGSEEFQIYVVLNLCCFLCHFGFRVGRINA